jgi:hypothetical protein
MKLIDKDAVVAEIEKKLNSCKTYSTEYVNGKKHALKSLLSFLDTLEVKEVDLEEKATQLSQKYFPDEENIWARPNIEAQSCKSACIEMAEWLKTQKGG